jgi:hypothetical protein
VASYVPITMEDDDAMLIGLLLSDKHGRDIISDCRN